MAERRSRDFKKLVEEGFISEHAYMDREQARIEQQTDLTTAVGQEKQMRAAIAQSGSKREEIISSARKVALESLNDGMQKKNLLEQELAKAQFRKEQATLKAPVDGSVQQLAVHTVGGVVTPAQALMVIVPTDKPLDIEVFLPNKDIGFVKPNQPVEIKVEAFPYTKYGVIRGTVASITNDAIADEKLGLIYSAKIAINPEQDKDSTNIKLSPGLAVTAEIKTDRRRVIEYFLSPLMEYKSESLKER
jgi:hemolysin D